MKFDELNQLKRFFSTMDIPASEQKKRVKMADLFYDAVIYTFTMIKIEKDLEERLAKEKDIESATKVLDGYKETLQNRIYDVFEMSDIPFEDEYIPRLVDEIIDTTARHPDEEYYTSQDRALIIAQNEANTALNYADYITAVDKGKTYKVWNTEGDTRVRSWHEAVDGMIVPINEYFLVGTDTMRFPHDFLNGTPENLINCRCVCTYE